MSRRKERLRVTVDPEVVVAANQAVAAGQAESLSGWVNSALAERAWRDRKLGTGLEGRPPSGSPGASPGSAGALLAASGGSDVVDAAVMVLANDGDDIVASDQDDFEILAAAAGRHVELIRP